MAPFLRVEEKGLALPRIVEMRNADGTSDGEPVVVLLVRGYGRLKVVPRIEGVVTQELENISMEAVGAGFGLR